MANAVTVQKLVDGVRNVVIKIDGYVDTSDVSATDIIDPASLDPIDINGQLASTVRIDAVRFSVDEGLAVTLLWDATADVRILDLVKTGHLTFDHFGGITNNAGTGKTGKVQLSTEGWSSGKVYEFSVILECVKQ